jgi:NADPH-dependent 2,4-dienoyl-CoA reductase/sulfur reductase-like enzyme
MAERDAVLIVGGGPTAHAAAAAYREAGGEGAVRIIASEPEWPYERPPLTKDFLRGETGREALLLDHVDWYRTHEVEVELGTEVAELDLEAGLARDADSRSWSFERCLLATGARPLVPEIPGSDGPDVRTVRTIGDSEQLRALAECSVLVVGSGFIGCEAAASLAMLGAEVAVATDEPSPQLARLGEEVSARISGWLQGYGVTLLGGAKLEEIRAVASGSLARFEDGREHEAAAVVLALGVERNDELAAGAGIEVDDGVPVDAAMRSADPRLLVAGDVAHAENATAGRRLRVEHWGEALNMGAVAGRTLAGEEACWDVAPGFWSVIGDQTLKFVGWDEDFDQVRFEAGADGAFVARYGRDGELVGVLAHEDNEAYERGREEVEGRARWS